MGSRMKVFDSISIVISYRKVFNAITKENLKPNIENLSLKGPHPFKWFFGLLFSVNIWLDYAFYDISINKGMNKNYMFLF